jgi:hypothetical protein
MPCERFREALSRHAAGDGIDGAAAAHLDACRACAARLDLQRRLLAEVDAELERALAIEASPELVARVIARSRVASDTAWRVRAAWTGLAAAAALAVGLYLRAPVDAPAAPREQASAQQSPAAPAAVRLAPGPVRSPGAPRASDPGVTASNRSRPVRMPRAAAKSAAEPEVLVQPDQARAIARLRELLIAGRLTEQMLPPIHPHEAAELSVAPLRIADIAVPDVDSAGHTDAVSRERQ